VKLLFAENLSFRLVGALADVYPESAHVRDVGLLGAEDPAIWAYAAEQGFLLTSKDTDFYDRSVYFGAPAQGSLAAHREQHRCGNCRPAPASVHPDPALLR
jgi:predicted nuclease of predicted toxin-antitoxin system